MRNFGTFLELFDSGVCILNLLLKPVYFGFEGISNFIFAFNKSMSLDKGLRLSWVYKNRFVKIIHILG